MINYFIIICKAGDTGQGGGAESHELLSPSPFFYSKNKIGKKRGDKKNFKAETIITLSPRSKCYCFSHPKTFRIQKVFLSANHSS